MQLVSLILIHRIVIYLALVVQTLDSAIHRIKIQWITQLVSQILIRWIVIYPVDSAIQRLNDRSLADSAIQLLNNQGENLSFSLLISPYLAKYMVCKAAMLAVNS